MKKAIYINMKENIVLFLITYMTLASVAFSKTLTKEEEMILKTLRDQGQEAVIKTNKKDRFNKKVRVSRDDSRILKLPISVNDRTDIMICYNSPIVIKFGPTLKDSVNAVYSGNNKVFDVKKMQHNEKSVLVALIQEPNKDANFATPLWIERTSDKRSYIFNLISERCADKGIMNYPIEIIIKDKLGVVSKDQRLLLPSDLIYEMTNNYKRLREEKNIINSNGIMATANSSWIGLSLSVRMKTLPKGKVNSKSKTIQMKKPRFVFLDSLKVRKIPSDSEYLYNASRGETNLINAPVARFNIMLNINKKYIFERKFVYALVIFDDERYYQIVKIPIKKLYDDLVKSGFEV